MRRTLGFLLTGALWGAAATGNLACDGTTGTNGQNGLQGPAGPAGPAGPKGDSGSMGTPGTNGKDGASDPSISAVTPGTVLGARPATLVITGVGTHWKAGTTTVDFGDTAITVNKVDVGSPTNLRVAVTIAPQATVGLHNVTVNTPGAGTGGANEQLVIQGGLTVQASLFAEVYPGLANVPSVPQGGLVRTVLRNLDYRDNPFDLTQTRPISGLSTIRGLLAPPTPIVNGTTYGSLFLVDALAPVGGLGVGLSTQTPLGQGVAFASDPKDTSAPMVQKRDPVTLTLGAGVTNQGFLGNEQTTLYKLTTPADNYVATVNVNTMGASLLGGVVAAPRIAGALAPTTGRFAEGLPFDTSPTVMAGALKERNGVLYLPKAGDYYFALYTDSLLGSTDHSYDYSILAKAAFGTNVTLKETTADTAAAPLATITLDKPYYGTDGAIDTDGETDYIKFTPSKTGRVMVSVANGTGATVGVGLYAMDCTTVVAAGTGVRSAPGASAMEASVTMGSTYCARVTGSVRSTYQFVVTQDLP